MRQQDDWLARFKLHVTEASFERSKDMSHADIDLLVAFRSRQHFYDFEKDFEGENTYELIAARDV